MQTNHLPTPFIPALHQHLVQWPRRTSGKTSTGKTKFVPPDLHATQAEKALWKFGDDGDRYHRAKILRPLPTSIGNAVATVYKQRYRAANDQHINSHRRSANLYLTGIYNRHLSKKLAALVKNPLIYKPSEVIVDDEYLQMTFGKSKKLQGLNQHSKNAHKSYLNWLLENYDFMGQGCDVGLMPVKATRPESEDARMIRFDDGGFQLKLPMPEMAAADTRHLHQFYNRTDDQLRDYAFDMVRIMYQFMIRLINAGQDEYTEDSLLIRIYHLMVAIPNQMGISEKYQKISTDRFTEEHAQIGIARLLCEKWWLRKLRKVHRQKHEEIAIACGVVHNGTQCYVSNDTYRYYQRRDAENKKVLADMVAYNEDTGEEIPLALLIEKSVANPQIRRHELMVRMRGCEDYAKAHDHVGLFITVTAPSRYHPTATKKLFGKSITVANPKYQGATPDQTNRYLNNVWALIRSAMEKFSIKPYGFRVVEPHEDETPHQHYMLFCQDGQQKKIIELFKHYGLQVDGHEAGAKKHRVTIVKIDPAKGSATGYIAKYISKNIDGYQADGQEIDGDLYGNSAANAAKRITAWRKCWGIRAFQPFGQPSVTIWRELRKFNSDDIKQHKQKLADEKAPDNAHVLAWLTHTRPTTKCDDDIIEQSRFFADTSQWDKYIDAMGGVNIPASHRPLSILTDSEPRQNRYNEAVPHKAIGVRSFTGSIVTSGQRYTLHRKGQSPYHTDAAKALRAALKKSPQSGDALDLADAPAQPRSAVNNCTDGAAEQPKQSDNGSNDPIFTPLFNYPAPPGTKEQLEDAQITIKPKDQALADQLLQTGFNRHQIPGLIKRLKKGGIARYSGSVGYKLTTIGSESLALVPCKMTDPALDWWDDPDETLQDIIDEINSHTEQTA